jgi:hypothetical protein
MPAAELAESARSVGCAEDPSRTPGLAFVTWSTAASALRVPEGSCEEVCTVQKPSSSGTATQAWVSM